MMHCGGGPGPSSFDAIAAIDQWRDKNQAPEILVAARYADTTAVLIGGPSGKPLSTRPLCAYPKVARWIGKGSPDEAQNYACQAPRAKK
jgi:hypothetical protein